MGVRRLVLVVAVFEGSPLRRQHDKGSTAKQRHFNTQLFKDEHVKAQAARQRKDISTRSYSRMNM